MHALQGGEALDHGDHGGREGDVVDEGAGHGGAEEDDGEHQVDIAAADFSDALGQQVQHTAALQPADDHEKPDKEDQGIVVDLPQDGDGPLAEGQQRHHGDEHADGGDGEPRLGVGGEQEHRREEDGAAAEELLGIVDGVLGVQIQLLHRGGLELLMEAEAEVGNHQQQTDAGDEARVGDEIPEAVAERCADDDVGRVAAHGGGASQVGAEDLRQDGRHRVKLQKLPQLDGHGGEEEDDRDAVDEHGEGRRKQHEGEENGEGPVVDRLGDGDAEPLEKAAVRHAFHHDHHAREEHDGLPVDAAALRGLGAVPEGGVEEALQVQGLPHGGDAVHADPEDQQQRGRGADQGHEMPGRLLGNDEAEHDEENDRRQDLGGHRTPSFSVENQRHGGNARFQRPVLHAAGNSNSFPPERQCGNVPKEALPA